MLNTRRYDPIIHFKTSLTTYKSLNDIVPNNLCVNWVPLENHSKNTGNPVRYYCRCLCLCSSHMVIVCLMLQPPLCGIGCRQILEMRRLFKSLNLCNIRTHSRLIQTIINECRLNLLFGLFRYIIFGVTVNRI